MRNSWLPLLLLLSPLLDTTRTAKADNPVKIIIAAGQSNMEGPGSVEELATIAPELTRPREDVFCIYAGRPSGPLGPGFGFRSGNFGPELKFGHILGDSLENDVIIIKSSIGGTTLDGDWRPPSAVKRKGGEVGVLYQHMIGRVHNLLRNLKDTYPEYEGQGFELAGMIWMQGESDSPPERASKYEKNLTDFITDVRNDLGVEGLPFVIGQINDSGAWDDHGNQGPVVREAQAKVARRLPHCAMIVTKDLHPGYHYDSESHVVIGERFANALLPLLGDADATSNEEEVFAAGDAFFAREYPDEEPDTRSLANGLLGYWNFDEGKGQKTRGMVRKTGNGELSEGVTWQPGVFGQSVKLDHQETITFPEYSDSTKGKKVTALSISVWIQSPLKGGGHLVGNLDHEGEKGWAIDNFANESWARMRSFVWKDGLLETRSDWGGPLMHGDGYEWHHVVGIFDGKRRSMDVFVDGRPVPKSPQEVRGNGILASDAPLVMGGALHGEGNYQAIDEFAIWSRALSPGDVAALYNNGRGVSLPIR